MDPICATGFKVSKKVRSESHMSIDEEKGAKITQVKPDFSLFCSLPVFLLSIKYIEDAIYNLSLAVSETVKQRRRKIEIDPKSEILPLCSSGLPTKHVMSHLNSTI